MTGERYPIFMTDVFDDLNDTQFVREWVPELLDQLACCDQEKMPFADLARMLADIRSRYNSILKRKNTKGTTHLNALQVRIIRRATGHVTHPFLSEIFGVSTPVIALILQRRVYRDMNGECRSRRRRRAVESLDASRQGRA